MAAAADPVPVGRVREIRRAAEEAVAEPAETVACVRRRRSWMPRWPTTSVEEAPSRLRLRQTVAYMLLRLLPPPMIST